MLETKNQESNYLCRVVELRNVRKHKNADRLQVVNIGMNSVITGMDAKDGDIYVFFPLESKINPTFLAATNSFRDSMANADTTKKGYFEDNCRVRATRLRGEKSMGYIVPARQVEQWSQMKGCIEDYVGQEFDTVNGVLLVEKYQVKPNKVNKINGQPKQPNLTRLVDGQINLHGKTKNLRHYPEAIEPSDIVSITYKTHGTSWWIANVLTKPKLTWLERLAKRFGVRVRTEDYDVMYGSRNVVKNRFYDDPKQQDHFYGVNVWKEIKDQIGHLVPKGWTLYGEALGFTETGEYIQKGFDYGCDPKGENGKPRMKLEVYRITVTNADGEVIDLTYPQIEEFCINAGINTPHLFFYGKAGEWLTRYMPIEEIASLNEENWSEKFVTELESVYNEKDCFMCNLSVPEEGIVIRKEKAFGFEGYKLKSFRFLEKETKNLDKGERDIEEEN